MNMPNSLVSVIMPAFNPDKDLIKKAIASVFSQSYPMIELIIGDDGSRNPIECYINELISDLENPRNVKIVVVRNNQNLGISRTRNNAIEYSSGKWLVWLDSDDTLQYDCIENLMNKTDSWNYIIGECNVYENDSVSRRKPKPIFDAAQKLLGTEKDPFLLNIISIQPQLILKSDLIEIGAFNEDFRYAELTELFLRYVFFKGLNKVGFIENAVYNYNRNIEHTLSSNRKELFKYRLMALTNYKNYFNISSDELVYVERDQITGFQKYKLLKHQI